MKQITAAIALLLFVVATASAQILKVTVNGKSEGINVLEVRTIRAASDGSSIIYYGDPPARNIFASETPAQIAAASCGVLFQITAREAVNGVLTNVPIVLNRTLIGQVYKHETNMTGIRYYKPPTVVVTTTTSIASLISMIDDCAPGSDGDDWGDQVVQVNATLSGDGKVTNPLKIAQQGATNGQVLKWNGTTWAPADDGGGGGGGATDLSIANRTTTTLDVVSSSGVDATVPAATTSLAGLMNSTDKTKIGHVTVTQAVDLDAIEAASHAAVTVTDNNRIDLTLTGQNLQADLAQQGATSGQVLKWNGTSWAPGDDGWTGFTIGDNLIGDGSVGNPLDWNGANVSAPISGSGTTLVPLTIANNSISATHIAADAVGASELADNSVASLNIIDGSVALADLAFTPLTVVTTDATLAGDGTAGNVLKVAQQGATSGQVLKWNGSTWAPGSDNTGGSGSTDLSFAGTSSPVTLESSSGTDVQIASGTGVSLSQGAGVLTITNSSPDQTVSLTGGTGISTSGTYPNFTITNSAPDQTVTMTSGSGISVTGTYPSFTVTNTGDTNAANDITTSTTAGGDLLGTYPNPTVGQVSEQFFEFTFTTSVNVSTTQHDLNVGTNTTWVQTVPVDLTGISNSSNGRILFITNASSNDSPITLKHENTGSVSANRFNLPNDQDYVINGGETVMIEYISGKHKVVGVAANLSIANRTTTTLDIASSNGVDATVPEATTSLAGLMNSTDKTKIGHVTVTQAVDLDAIESASHAAVTVVDGTSVDFTLTGQQLTAELSGQGASNGQVLKFNGTAWVPGTDNNTGATNLTITGTTSPFTIDSDTGSDVNVASGTGISLSESPANTLVITNSAPDQTVTMTSGSGISVTGTYPSFTVTNSDPDQSTTNEVLTVSDGTDSEALGGQTLTFSASGGATVDYNPATNTLNINAGSSSGGDNWGSQVVEKGATLTGTGVVGNVLDVATNGIGNTQMADNAVGSAEIVNGSVALVDMADVATSTVFYRKTAGTGSPETQTLATLKSDLGLTGTNSGDQTITLTGDVTGSGTGSFAATISDNSVDGTDIAFGSDALGDTYHYNGTDVVRLAGNTTTTKQFLSQTGTGTVSAAPAWSALAQSDIPAASGGDVTGLLSNLQIATGVVGAAEVTDNSLAAADLAVNVVSSIDGVTNDGADIDFVASGSITITPNDAANTITFAVAADGDGSSTNEIQDVTITGTSSPFTVDLSGTSNDVNVASGTGISLSESPANTLVITNSAPDQTVTMTSGSGISVTGTYPSFTVTNSGDLSTTNEIQDVTITGTTSPFTVDLSGTSNDVNVASGTGISLSESPANTLVITNSAPDQTVTMTSGTGISVTGTYPSFTVTNSDPDQSTTNEVLTVSDGTDSEALGGQTLTFSASGGATVDYNPATNTLNINAGSSSGGDNWGSQVVEKGATLTGTGVVGNVLDVATNGIGNTQMADNAIGNAEMLDNAIGNAEMADNAIGNAEMADNAIGSNEIVNGSVALVDMANVATSTVFYRKTAGTGSPETQTLATLKSDLGLTGTNSGDQTITLTGDVTGSGTGSFAATIADNSVDGTDIAFGSDLLGDTYHYNGTDVVRLAGNTTTTKQFLSQTGTGTVSAAPAWSALAQSDIPAASGGDVTGLLSNLQIASGVVGSTEVTDNSLSAADLAVNVVSSVGGVTNDGGGITFIESGIITIIPDDVNNTITFAVGADGDGSATNEIQDVTITGTSSPFTIDLSLTSNDVNVSSGTGILLSESPANTLVITNSAPDQTVTMTSGSGISVTGTYPSFTVTNSGDLSTTNEIQDVTITGTTSPFTVDLSGTSNDVNVASGTGISLSESPANTLVITNSAPDQTVTMTSGTGISVTGTYPSFTVTNSGDTNASDDITTATSGAGDVTGTFPTLTVDGLQGVGVSATTPTTNQVLKYNGSIWAPAADDSGGAPSGTDMQTLRYNGTTLTANSILRNDGNRIGINKDPAIGFDLALNGAANATTYVSTGSGLPYSTTASSSFRMNNTVASRFWYLGHNDNGSMRLYNDGPIATWIVSSTNQFKHLGSMIVGTNNASIAEAQFTVVDSVVAETNAVIENKMTNGASNAKLTLKSVTTSSDTYIYMLNGGGGFSLGIDGDQNDDFTISGNATLGTNNGIRVSSTGRVGIGTQAPLTSARLTVPAATTTIAPLNFVDGGSLKTTAADGDMEFVTDNLYISGGTTRYTIMKALTGSTTWNPASTAAGDYQVTTFTVTGAADGDVVALGVPNASVPVSTNTFYTARVSATNTVEIKFHNQSGGTVDPGSGTFKVSVMKY